MEPTFTADEKLAILELLRADLAYYHENLVLDHKTVASAMAAYDVTHAVTAMTKLDPDGAAEIRKNVAEYVQEYLD